VFYNGGMKKKRWMGAIVGGVLGFVIVFFVYTLQNNFDCFSCGFIDINYCSHQAGACSDSSLYIDIVTFLSIPFSYVALLSYYAITDRLVSFYTLVVELMPLFILYWMILGYLLEKIIRLVFASTSYKRK